MQSMTGCGKGAASDAAWEVTVELKSVNHRFLDVACRLPRNLGFLEEPLRRMLAGSLRRGHVETWISLRSLGAGETTLTLDEALARQYLQAAETLQRLGAAGNLSPAALMQLEGVLTRQETALDEEAVLPLFRAACGDALAQLTAMRGAEGEQLKADLQAHLAQVVRLREEIAALAPQVVEDYRERLQSRLAQLPVTPVEPQRLAQEVALLADRCCIDEELSRLQSHIGQFRIVLEAPGEAGKKLDFLIQEMNREANTIGSKANHAGIAQRVVELKSEIEKLREQVQNVE
jgi:uncharacterized protein (TIGR00255 family)